MRNRHGQDDDPSNFSIQFDPKHEAVGPPKGQDGAPPIVLNVARFDEIVEKSRLLREGIREELEAERRRQALSPAMNEKYEAFDSITGAINLLTGDGVEDFFAKNLPA